MPNTCRNGYIALLSGRFVPVTIKQEAGWASELFGHYGEEKFVPFSGIKPMGPWYRIIGENFAVDREVPCLTRLKILLAFSQYSVIGMLDNLNPVHFFKY
jgi:hypothetical protein